MASRSYRSPVRTRHAEDTRQTIIDAARTLFVEQGYPRTSVAAVAAAAGVALNTVYASVGGKADLILAMTEVSTDDDLIAQALTRIGALTDPSEIVRVTAESTGEVTRRQLDTIAVLLDNRTADPAVATAADLATRRYAERLALIAGRLTEVAGLRPELTREKVQQILWFYFGAEAWRTAQNLGWTWAEATDWLTEQAGRALLPEAGL
jgi:AcrR family transcriptional regulator